MSMKMRFLGMVMFLAALILAGGVPSVRGNTIGPGAPGGPDPFVFNFDENGNGVISQNGGPFLPLNGALAPDPSNGFAPALTYMLPTGVTVGNWDVEVFDGTALGDVIRFTDGSGNLTGTTADRVIFYSDVTSGDAADSIADVAAPPTNLGTGAVTTVTEQGTEGANGFTYTSPTPPGGSPDTFNGISDGTLPEPTSLILLGSGLLGILGITRRKWLR